MLQITPLKGLKNVRETLFPTKIPAFFAHLSDVKIVCFDNKRHLQGKETAPFGQSGAFFEAKRCRLFHKKTPALEGTGV